MKWVKSKLSAELLSDMKQYSFIFKLNHGNNKGDSGDLKEMIMAMVVF